MKNKILFFFATTAVVLAIVSFTPAPNFKVADATSTAPPPSQPFSCTDGWTISNPPLLNNLFCNPPGYNPNVATGNVFGWAWSSNIGWIKMNDCAGMSSLGIYTNDPNDPNDCTAPFYGVNLDSNGKISGTAWSSNIGWVGFGKNIGDNTGSSVSTSGLFSSGWANVLSGDLTGFFDGFIGFSGIHFPSGPTTPLGMAGLTLVPINSSSPFQSGSIVGYAWGGNVVGWILFGGGGSTNNPSNRAKVVYGALAADQQFNFTISASPSAFTPALPPLVGTSYDSTITLNLVGSSLQDVTLIAPTYSGPPGSTLIVSLVTVSGGNMPGNTCNSSVCNKILRLATTGQTLPGSYTVTITATPTTGAPKTATVILTVPPLGGGGVGFDATCTTLSLPPHLVNTVIVRKVIITSGVHPYTLTWTGTNQSSASSGPFTPLPIGSTPNSTTGAITYTFPKHYANIGLKDATVKVIELGGRTTDVVCIPNVLVIVNSNTGES